MPSFPRAVARAARDRGLPCTEGWVGSGRAFRMGVGWMPRLSWTTPQGSREQLLKDRLTIGRVEGVDLVLDDKGCSRRHCELVLEGGAWKLRDLGSSNGTF